MNYLISPYFARFLNKAIFSAALVLGSTQVFYAKSNFLIWPIYPVIESQEKATPVWLENTGDEASMMQVRVFKWSQNNNKDQYEN